MSDFLPLYQKVDPTTWAYLSSLLIIGIFFMFRRVWSVRNLDVVLLILLAPGLILAQKGIAELVQAKAAKTAPAVASNDVRPLAEAEPVAVAPPKADVQHGYQLVRWGYLWLLAVSMVWLIRMLLDPTMVRRPLLEPNLSMGGMLFWCV